MTDPLAELQAQLERFLRTDRQRTALLFQLARRSPVQALPALLEAARKIESDFGRFLVLHAILLRSVGPSRDAAQEAALDAADSIEDESQHLLALETLGTREPSYSLESLEGLAIAPPHLAPLGRARRLIRVVNSVGLVAVDTPAKAFDAFLRLAPALAKTMAPGRYGGVLARAATSLLDLSRATLSSAQLQHAFETVSAFNDDRLRAAGLVSLAPNLPGPLFRSGLNLAGAIGDAPSRARALTGFLERHDLPTDLKVDASRRALDAANSIVRWQTQAGSFRQINRVIDNASIREALDLEIGLARPGVKARALAALAPRLDVKQAATVFEVAQTLEPGWGRTWLLRSLESHIQPQRSSRASGLAAIIRSELDATEDRPWSRPAMGRSAGWGSESVRGSREAANVAVDLQDPEIAAAVANDPAAATDFVLAALRALPPFAVGDTGSQPSLASIPHEPWPQERGYVVSTGFSDIASVDVALPKDASLPLNTRVAFWVEVGPTAALGAIDDVPTELPVELLPKEGASLQVVVLSNHASLTIERPGRGEIQIQRDGRVHVRRPAHRPLAQAHSHVERRLFFVIRTPGEAGRYRLRCGVYFRGVLVQSREVELDVGETPRNRPALITRVDYTIDRTLEPAHLHSFEPHVMSVLVNRATDSTHNVHLVGDYDFDSTAAFDSHEIDDHVRRIREALRTASWGTASEWDSQRRYLYEQRATFQQLLRDLYGLALAGYRVWDQIVERLPNDGADADELRERMRKPAFVQLALRDSPRLMLPLGVLYDYPFNVALGLDECRLCDHFQRHVGEDQPLYEIDCFNGKCPTYDDVSAICPSGFWGFRHAVGIPPSLSAKGDSPATLPTFLEPADDIGLGVAVCLDERLQHRVAHETALRAFVRHARFTYADSWQKTLDMMSNADAQVVYFYCHGGVRDRSPYIQVGPMSDYAIERSTLRDFVKRWAKPRPRPLVFINGCHTVGVAPEVAIEMVSAFILRVGASAVVGTEITVFEQLATKFGTTFLTGFLGERLALGEAVRRARLTILREQLNPLGLVYLPFGLASLRLGPALRSDPN